LKRNLVFTLATVAIVATTILAACGPATPTASVPTTGAVTSMGTPKVIELTISDHNPPQAAPAPAAQAYGKYIEEKSGGRVKVKVVIGAALLQEPEAYPAVQKGVVDAASYAINAKEGFKLNTVMCLPFMGFPDQVNTTKIYWELVKKFPQMEKEWEGTKYAAMYMMPPTHLHFTKRVVKTPTDIKGVKMCGAEASVNETLAAVGAVPVETSVGDLFVTINSGATEGMLNHFPVAFVFGALDILKSHTTFGVGGINKAAMGLVWNKAKYDSLPADIKKIVDDARVVYEEVFAKADSEMQNMVMGIVNGRKDNIVELTDAQVKDWYNLVKGPMHDKWINEAKAKGLPGQEVYNEALKLAEQYKGK
jgi:TRAP-type transport system periplasmic protein